jgi:3D (Asp-Asp-Asp) domain-containing protein
VFRTSRRGLRRLVLAAAAVVLAGTAITVATTADAATTKTYYVTLYGWPDNSPPGNGIAYPRIHSHAGGKGTYADPVTFAANHGLKPGTRVYIPYMKKYFIMEDQCASCSSTHIDLWAGGSNATKKQVLACEDALTRHASVVLSPAKNLPVNTTPIFNTSTRKCFKP